MDYGGKKMPMWQWVIIYLIIGVVVYGLIYYYFMMKKGGSLYQAPTTTTQQVTGTVTPKVTIVPAATNVVMERTDATKGSYLTDLKGMTLYTFDNDTVGVSNCSGNCLAIWPAFVSTSATVKQANLTVITRADGTMQYTWMGMPLYYYAKDVKAGDILGDGVGGIWHIVKL